jgi:hypothetical protein
MSSTERWARYKEERKEEEEAEQKEAAAAAGGEDAGRAVLRCGNKMGDADGLALVSADRSCRRAGIRQASKYL